MQELQLWFLAYNKAQQGSIVTNMHMNNTPWDIPISQLGIEYDTYFKQRLIPALLRWEQEWLSNATKTYGSDAGEVWAQDILTRLQEHRLQSIDVEDMINFTPNLLSTLLWKQAKNLSHSRLIHRLNSLNLGK